MAHVVSLDDVWRMLAACAPGYQARQSKHYWIVNYGKKSYRSLPLGEHGRRTNVDIETGHVRSMVRHLEISVECAKGFLDLG